MTIDEVKIVIEQLRKSGASDEQIARFFGMMFVDDKLDVQALTALIHVLGYELEENFLKETKSNQKKIIKKMYGIR